MMTTTPSPFTRRLIHQGLLSVLALSMVVQPVAAESVFDDVFGSDPFANNSVGFGGGATVGEQGVVAGGPDGAYVGGDAQMAGSAEGSYIDDSLVSAGGSEGAYVEEAAVSAGNGGGSESEKSDAPDSFALLTPNNPNEGAYVGGNTVSAGGEEGAYVAPEVVSAGGESGALVTPEETSAGGEGGAVVFADPVVADPPAELPTNNVNTGIVDGGVVGNSNQTFEKVGNAIAGDANDANITSQATTVATGDNTNQNSNNTQVSATNQTQVAPQFIVPGGSGGNSVLMLPQNPLQMLPDRLARKLFQVQFGARNNPNIGGGSNSMSWFMQSGLSIPFGKIPEPLRARSDSQMDLVRERLMDRDRQAFASLSPNSKADVQGKVVGLNAYNFAAMKTAKIDPNTPTAMMASAAPLSNAINLSQPRVLALAEAKVFTRPLNTGNEIGKVEMGEEYPYLGHTKSGWVKVLLPNGEKGWTLDQFEYIKSDYTQVDELAEKITLPARQTAVNTPARKNSNSRSRTLIR